MKNVYVALLLNILFISTDAQNFSWGKSEGLWAYDYGYATCTDNAGNLYVTGKYEEVNANFSGTTVGCQGNHDVFLAKYNPAGTLLWIKTAGGVLGDYALGITTDGVSYVAIAGEIEGVNSTIYFEGTSGTLTSVAHNDIFLAKYDLNGQILWAKQAGWWHNEKAQGITHDNAGNLYICGFYNDSCYFDNTLVTGYGGKDIYIAKYDPNGNFQWVRKAGSPGRDEAKGIICDANGDIYICGMFENGCEFGNNIFSAPGTYFDSFIAKYSPNGSLQWVRTGQSDYDDVAWGITKDNAGKLYIAGEFNAYAVFGNIALTTNGLCDIFVACYDANGNIHWATPMGGDLVDRARGIGCDGNNLYITGQFGASVSFGPSYLTAVDSSDIFIAGLTNSGSVMWGMAVGGTADIYEDLGYESGNAICADAIGNVYATGALLDNGVFGSTTVTTWDRTDAFITRIEQLGVGVQGLSGNVPALKIYPNPSTGNFTVDLSGLPYTDVRLCVYDCTGRAIHDQRVAPGLFEMELALQGRGVYLVEVHSGERTIRERVVIQ